MNYQVRVDAESPPVGVAAISDGDGACRLVIPDLVHEIVAKVQLKFGFLQTFPKQFQLWHVGQIRHFNNPEPYFMAAPRLFSPALACLLSAPATSLLCENC